VTDWYDREGKLISMWKANELLADYDYKVLKKDVFVFHGSPVEVSTVWLGLNHNWYPGPPLIFETMIFGGRFDLEAHRYATEAQAREGHAEVLAFLQLEGAQHDDTGSRGQQGGDPRCGGDGDP
jgi:hypothetical protein